MIINIGSNAGVKEGLAVISEEGLFIGKIYDVNYDFSTVLLVTDNHSKVAASILNKDKTIGIIEGKYGLSCKMNLIPQNEEIQENDLLITSGLETNIPQGLVIGQVDRVENVEGDLFKSASIKLLLDLNKVKIVSVLTP